MDPRPCHSDQGSSTGSRGGHTPTQGSSLGYLALKLQSAAHGMDKMLSLLVRVVLQLSCSAAHEVWKEVSCGGDGPRVRVTAGPGMPPCLHPSAASSPTQPCLFPLLSEAREVAQQVTCLLHKCEDHGSDPQNLGSTGWVWQLTCNCTMQKTRDRVPRARL